MTWSCLLFGLWLVGAICLPVGDALAADAIHFKDGMRTVCHGKAWEENNTVFCEYDGGLLSYPKAEVDHIEKGPDSPRPPEASPLPAASPFPPAAPSPEVRQPEAVQAAATGVLFYDPRRPQKYWSRADRKHDTFPEALAALAGEYERPPQWVEESMGDSNDLGVIRATLSSRKMATLSQATGLRPGANVVIEFYNPRRPEKYWTGPEARHTTYAVALEALGREFEKPAEWVERHMGDTNDLEEIRASLRHAQADKAE